VSLRERALDLAKVSLDDGPVLPFVLLASAGELLQHITVVSANSHAAMSAAHRIVREQGGASDEYAIVVDTYVRVEGQRHDAVLVEAGHRGADEVIVVAQRYSGRDFVGELLEYERRPPAYVKVDPQALRWGAATPDFYNDKQKHAIHVINHLLEPDNVTRTVRFVRARARHFERNLPRGTQQSAFIEDRGQDVSPELRERFERELVGIGVQYMSELRRN